MTPLLATLLITHVIAGIIAISMLYVLSIHLLKRTPNFVFLSRIGWTAALLFWLSWATSAYYYVTYYGKAVKPRILEGTYPAGHIFFMEAKEHVFLVLPFAVLSLAVALSMLRRTPDEKLKRAAQMLAFVCLVIGTFTAAAGIIVSGSV
ncbi:hypothetical protein A3D62_00610 [Candidatus Kaiserbacteria bacterium RIFCSPHIGHO2_02_FULL_49_11]|uniref:DUF420 domain-containing protein n=1 Tax=Candidatus Kaiserbacteria bacterium RIFCSPHIGHO2_02_FULL_49_11 TaxID=1798489 RepID=A0A1F6CZU3_9BACT|nr:MAG: hypothetical protein A3D62_00610 [Candidatus Kaiserbacteria bacterium RIFCSPHIGHO2_02_FULL_49_11]